jgi:hypothetical protein
VVRHSLTVLSSDPVASRVHAASTATAQQVYRRRSFSFRPCRVAQGTFTPRRSQNRA